MWTFALYALYIKKRKPWAEYYTFAWQKLVFFLRTFYCPISEVYWMPCWFIFYSGELVIVEPQNPTTSIIEVYLTLDSSLFLAMNTQTRVQQIAILQRTWRRTRKTWLLTVQPQQMKGLKICHLNVRSLPCHLKEVKVLTKPLTVFMSLQWAKHGWSPPGITVSSPWKTIVKFIAVTGGMTKKGVAKSLCLSKTLSSIVDTTCWIALLTSLSADHKATINNSAQSFYIL